MLFSEVDVAAPGRNSDMLSGIEPCASFRREGFLHVRGNSACWWNFSSWLLTNQAKATGRRWSKPWRCVGPCWSTFSPARFFALVSFSRLLCVQCCSCSVTLSSKGSSLRSMLSTPTPMLPTSSSSSCCTGILLRLARTPTNSFVKIRMNWSHSSCDCESDKKQAECLNMTAIISRPASNPQVWGASRLLRLIGRLLRNAPQCGAAACLLLLQN